MEGGILREGLRVAELGTGLGKVLGLQLPSSVARIIPELLPPVGLHRLPGALVRAWCENKECSSTIVLRRTAGHH